MKNRLIAEITRKMLPCLDNAQMEQLQDVLQHCLWGIQITENPDAAVQQEKESNVDLLNMFLSAKRVEGCSDKTLHYYENSIRRLFAAVDCHVTHICPITNSSRSAVRATLTTSGVSCPASSPGSKMRIISLKARCEEFTRSDQAKR